MLSPKRYFYFFLFLLAKTQKKRRRHKTKYYSEFGFENLDGPLTSFTTRFKTPEMGFSVLQAMKALAATENGQDVQAALETLLGKGGSTVNERSSTPSIHAAQMRATPPPPHAPNRSWTTERTERGGGSGNFFELDVKTLLLQELARRMQLITKIRLTNSYRKLLRLG